MKAKSFGILEILLVYAVLQTLEILLRLTGIAQWEAQTLGWSYTGMFLFLGIPLLVVWLTRRNWAEYGVSLTNWQTNLDIGIKAYLVRIIPYVIGMGGAVWLHLDTKQLGGGVIVAFTEIIAIALMIWILNRQKPVTYGRGNLIITFLLLLFPIIVALAMKKLSLIVASTVIWQFGFSGFGEEFVWRGYVQSRLNQAFGRPYRWFGVQFGAGLIIASLLFGLLHAFNTFDPAIGFASLSWGWAVSASFSGLMFGIIREKTGTLFAPGIAHGLPDAVGEALNKIFNWI